VCARDLAGRDRIVTGHVRRRIMKAVLELDVHPPPELVDVERRRVPVDPDLLTDPPRFLGGEAWAPGHGYFSVFR
jgi:hypothetical protein